MLPVVALWVCLMCGTYEYDVFYMCTWYGNRHRKGMIVLVTGTIPGPQYWSTYVAVTF